MLGGMAQLKGRWLACGVLACLVPLAPLADGYAADVPAAVFIVGQPTQPATVGQVTYTPIRRSVEPPPSAAAPASPAVIEPKPSASSLLPRPVSPAGPTSPSSVPASVPASVAASVPASVPAPAPAPSRVRASGEPAAVAAAQAIRPSRPGRHYLGLGTDVGMPDGLTLGLVLSPVDWLRISAALGTTSLSDPELFGLYRGGLALVPLGWGPSFSFEAVRRNVAPTTSVIRTFFSVPAWVDPYVQELGYTFFNAHLGFDYVVWGFTLYLHGGATYLIGTVRAPKPVVVDSKTNTSLNITQDGGFRALTLSAKAGIVYLFGGGG